MSEELLVVLNRSESSGFGFSLLGKPGLPPIIYNILDDSPAAESGEVSVVLSIHRYRAPDDEAAALPRKKRTGMRSGSALPA